jgi:hypothetical protein
LDENGTNYQDFNGTVCAKVDNNTSKLDFRDQNSSTATFKISKAIKDIRVDISWEKDVDGNCSLSNETNSTDNFAIRPDRFIINSISSPIYAGEDFNISFQALDDSNHSTTGYDENKSTSFDVNGTDIKPTCRVEDLNVSSFRFTDGNASDINASYGEVGEINVTIKEDDNCSKRFAGVDCKDQYILNHWNSDTNTSIDENSTIVTILPYEINITDANLSNIFDLDGNRWIYMDNNISELNVTANVYLSVNNKQHQVLQDFNSSCYAKDVNVTFYYDVNNSNGDVSVTYDGNLTDTNKSIADINKTLQIFKSDFIHDGNISKFYAFNVDRNYSKPLNPIFVDMKDVNATLTTAKYENNITLSDNNATFYYGRVKTKDVTTNKNSIKHSLHVEVYRLGRYHQNSLN